MNSTLKIDTPKNFRLREVLIINAFGIVPGCIIGYCGLGGILLLASAFFNSRYIFLAFGLVPLSICGAVIFLFPIALGNPYVRYIANRSLAKVSPKKVHFVCHVSFSPRLYDGFRGFMELADDVGHLQVTDEAVVFTGDHVRIVLPFTSIKEVSYSNCGWRGLWVYGQRIKITTNALDDFNSLEFQERQSNTVVSSRRISKEIIRELEHRTHSGDAADG